MAYQGLLFLHLLGVAMVFGGAAIGSMAGAMARRNRGTRELAVCLQLAGRSAMFAAPGAWLAMLTGTGIIWHMGYGFTKPWVVGSYLVWMTSFLTAMLVLRPRLGVALQALEAAKASNADEAPEVQAILSTGPVFAAMRTTETLAIVLVLLMVFKPGA